jgi:hypothetical protein
LLEECLERGQGGRPLLHTKPDPPRLRSILRKRTMRFRSLTRQAVVSARAIVMQTQP